MSLLGWILVFCALGSVLSVLLSGSYLLLSERWRRRTLPTLVSFAVGALLGAAFLALLPRAVEVGDAHAVLGAALLGLLLFFLLEKLVLWRHCHSGECDAHAPSAAGLHGHAPGILILFGDGLHNFVDGILIGAAFLTDINLGIVTSLAVAAHELPQELGDFAVLLQSGMSRQRALLLNLLSGATTVIGGLLAWWGLSAAGEYIGYVLAVAAASFIYIAVADLMPSLHAQPHAGATARQMAAIGAGVGVMHLIQTVMH